MRKSTLAALVLLGGMMFVFLWVANAGVEHHRQEIEVGTEMTREMSADLAPGSRVRLRRERGSADAIVRESDQHLLLVTATPSEARWRRDPQGLETARSLADRAHRDPRYGPERPIPVVEVVLTRPDGAKTRFGFREDRDGQLQGFAVPPLKP